MRRTVTRLACSVAVLACVAHLSAQAARLSKADATRFQGKLTLIDKTAATPQGKEVNAYLKFLAGAQVPVGIADPLLHAAGTGRVEGRAVVDLDAVRTQKKRAWTDPLGYLMGRLPVTASGTLTTKDGVGRFTLDTAAISGVTIPKSLLQELVSYYSRSAERPAGINMDQPFQLPAAIREITIGQGTATIVQ